MKTIPKIILILISTVVFTPSLFGQGNAAVGSVTLDGKVWNSLAFRPVIPIGKAALALDLVFYVDGEGNLHKDEWDFSSPTAGKNTVLDKIYYIRWGHRGDPLYFRIGALDQVSLGYGILVNRYSNTLLYPDVKRIGLDMGVKLGKYSLSGFFNDFKENASLAGVRLQTSAFTGFPVGVSAVLDRNQYYGMRDSDGDGRPDVLDDFPNNPMYWLDSDGDGRADRDPLEWDIDGDGVTDTLNSDIPGWTADTSIVLDSNIVRKPEPLNIQKTSDPVGGIALDVGFPLYQEKRMSIFIYAQAAKLIGETVNPETGEKVPLGSGLIPLAAGTHFGPLHFSLEYRMVPHGNFEFSYWSKSYDVERAVIKMSGNDNTVITKESGLGQYGTLKGLYAHADLDVMSWFACQAGYQHLVGDHWDTNVQQFVSSDVESFTADIRLTKSVSKLKTAKAYYQQQNVPNPFQFRYTENTLFGYNLALEMGSGLVITYKFQRTFVDLNGDGDVKDPKEAVNHLVFETSFSL